jgi:cytochrome c peroxidase
MTMQSRRKWTLALLALAGATLGCDDADDLTPQEWALVKQIEPLAGEMPRSPYNAMDQDDTIARFGQMLFFDKDVAEAITVAGPSGNVGEVRKVACVNCHDTKYFSDSRPTPGISHGRNWLATNTVSFVNSGWYEWTLSSGRFDSMVEHGTTVWGTSATPLAQARFVYRKYKDEYNAAFPATPLDDRLGLPVTDPANVYPATGGPKASATAADGPFEKMPADAQAAINQFRANLGRAFDTYPRKLTSPDSPFQRFARDRDVDALTPQQRRGLRLFIGKAACNDCHTGPTLSDNKFHNVATPSQSMLPGATTPLAPNRGRAGVMAAILGNLATLEANPSAPIFNGAGPFSDNRDLGLQRLRDVRAEDEAHCKTRNEMTHACTLYDETLEGAFRTASLLNVAETAPYFHGGLVATLEDVVRHYNQGGGADGTFVGTRSPRLRPLMLTEDEIADLVAFLHSLTGVAPADQNPGNDPNVWNWAKNTAKAPLPPDPPPAMGMP